MLDRLPTLHRLALPVLAALALLAGTTYVVLGASTPETEDRPPVTADSGEDYRSGSLPDDLDAAVAVASEALPLALTYDYRSIQEGLAEATALMTDDFGEEFSRTFKDSAQRLARDQKAVTDATVRAAGLVRVEDDRVLCLVYVDQVLVSSTTVQDTDAPVRVSQNRVLVGLTDDAGEWRVDSITPM